VNPVRVLVVDDHPGYAEMIVSRLSTTGWSMSVATSGEEALEILQREEIEILASDFHILPGINGAELVAAAVAFQPDLYCIIFTGFHERKAAVDALRAGVSEFLDKSERMEYDLADAIRRGIQSITLSRLGRQLLETDDEQQIFDILMTSLADIGRFDGSCLAVLSRHAVCTVERAVNLRTRETLRQARLERPDSAYRYVIDEQVVYLPPLIQPAGRTLTPFFETSQSIAIVPLILKGERGALGIELTEAKRLGIEDVRLLNQLARSISLALEMVHQQQERLRLEREIADDTKDLLARAAMHEIKNPLNAVTGLLQIAADVLPNGIRDSLLDNVSRINIALNDHFAELIRGEETSREDIVVAELVQDALTRFRIHPLRGKVDLVEQTSPALPTIVGHRALLVSAIVNLLDNAASFASQSPDPKVRIRADYAAATDQVEILVADNGPGIISENLGRIYDYAFSTRRESGHTGYGLAFVKDIVELNGGRVSVQSDEGQGATFTLSLPPGSLSQEAQNT
jgi:signal transduction histidine kinase/FixJ family two-component response regulator